MPRFLMISPYFPPMGVAGAKRPLFLARHLPRFGWEPIVLTAEGDREVQDPSLADAVPSALAISRGYGGGYRRLFGRSSRARTGVRPGQKRTKIFGRDLPQLLPTDPYLLDVRAAVREGARLARAHDARAIHVIADPWSVLLTGVLLRRRTGLPLVIDCRDPWSVHPASLPLRPAPTRRLVDALEERAFRAANKVVLNTEACCEAYVERYRGRIPEDRFTFIRNTFDPDVFAEGEPTRTKAFVVLYFGFFRRIVPSMPLFEGFARFVRGERLGTDDARLRFLGGLRPEDESAIRELGLDGYVETRPPVPYLESRTALRSADVLTLIVDPVARLCIPSKLYDYLAAGKPILALSANDELNRIVAETRTGIAIPPDDPSAVATALARLRAEPPRPDPAAIEPLAAEAQARRFASLLAEVTAGGSAAQR